MTVTWTILIPSPTAVFMLGLFALIFMTMERAFPCNPEMFQGPRKGLWTDLAYWYLNPILVTVLRISFLLVIVLPLSGFGDANAMMERFTEGFGPAARLPLWVQMILILVLQDIYLYWMHRLFHTRGWWNYHAVHHSSEQVDWLSSVRFHPVNIFLSFTIADLLVMVMGFPGAAIAIMAPYNAMYSHFVHANVRWTLGPLRYVLASPVFHRWHHTLLAEGMNKNFAPTFPILDILFGTYYMPKGKLPSAYGVGDDRYPGDVLGQMIYPLRKRT